MMGDAIVVFFQAEDGIRDIGVTGVQTCALPIGEKLVWRGDAGPPYSIEHFGFRDGLSEPFADLGLGVPPAGGATPRQDGSRAPIAPGELLLGHPDEDGIVQERPANAHLRNNGTYLV